MAGDKNPREHRVFKAEERKKIRAYRGKGDAPSLSSGKNSPEARRDAERRASGKTGGKLPADYWKRAKAGKTSTKPRSK